MDLECDKYGIGGGSKHCDDSRLVRIMFPTILSRHFAPAASVQSSYLTLSGCQLLLKGEPGVRQARKHGIGSGSKYCDDNDTQPDA